MKRYIAAMDQGTTSSRTILFDGDGCPVSCAQEEFRQLYPKPGWVEHDCRDIVNSQLNSFRAARASPTSAKRSWCGISLPASPSTTPSCGSAAALRNSASTSKPATPKRYTTKPA